MKGFDDAEFRDDDGCFVVQTNELTDKVTHPQNGIRIEFPSRVWSCGPGVRFLHSSALNREVSALSKSAKWESDCIRTGLHPANSERTGGNFYGWLHDSIGKWRLNDGHE